VWAAWQCFDMGNVMRDALDMENVPLLEHGCAFVALDREIWNACQILFNAEL